MRASTVAGVAAAALLQGADAFWRMPCGIIQTSRLDPIVSPGTVSGHVHKISGPPSFDPNSDYDSLFDDSCTSCAIQKDKSAYWTPLLYYQHKNGSFEEVPADGMVVYYLGRGENASYIEPFPKGFKMLSGDPTQRAYDNSTYTYGGQNGVIYTGGHCQTGDMTCVGGHFVNRTGTSTDPQGPVFLGRPLSERVSFACLDTSPQKETYGMTNFQCANGLRAQIHFQTCWDGINTFLPGNKHVDYLSQIDNGVCSPSFPVLLPHLFYEVLYGVANVQQDGGRFVFAMGDPTGYGFHGDFINGWDIDVLDQAIDQCINANPSGVLDECAPLHASQDDNSGFNCPEQPSYYNESVRGMLGTSLPGCNKVNTGPSPAPWSDMTCPAGTAAPALNPVWRGNSTGGAPTIPQVGSVQNGFQYAGCFQDDSSHSFSRDSTSADNMTNALCQSYCSSKSMPLAATEYSTQCFCGYSLNATSNPNLNGNCNGMVCGGNSSEYCGGASILSVFNSTTYTGTYNPTLPSPGQDAGGGYTYLGCASEATNGRALNVTSTTDGNNMTNAACATFCASKGQPLFGTEYGAECYCGSALASGSQLSQSGCTMACSGPAPASGPFAKWANTCGGASRLTVWRNNNVGKSGSTTSTVATSTFVTSVSTASPTTAPTSLPSAGSSVGSGFTYLGCASEASSGRALNVTSTTASNMTNAACASYCAAAGLPLFGTEYGKECYCGNVFASGAALGQSGCSSACAGPQPGSAPWSGVANVCGGASRLTVFNNTKIPAVANKAAVTVSGSRYAYKGCYADGSGSSRVLTGASTADAANMTVDKCVAFCQGKGFAVAGIEYADECYCGASLGSATKANEWDCNMQCVGDSGRWCGGGSRMSVYSSK